MSVLLNGYKNDMRLKNIKSRVGIIGDNSIAYVEALLNIWNEGNVPVLIDWRIPINVGLELLVEANATECYIEEKILIKSDNIKELPIKFHLMKSSSRSANLLPECLYKQFKSNYSNDEALIFFSSGTTGKAKGIVLSHYAINKNSDAVIDYMHPTNEDTVYIIKTLAHSSTLVCELLVGLKSNSKIVIAPTVVSPGFSFKNFIKYNTTIVCVNPTLLNLYIKACQNNNYEFRSLKWLYTSGSIANVDLLKEAQNTFKFSKVLNVYGLTEAGPRVTAQRYEDDYIKLGSVGKTINDVKIAVVDNNGAILPAMSKGIVHVDTPCKMKMYITGRNPKKSLYRDWINTGDVGYMDEDGDLYITGRYDNMIIQGSHNVYPEDIEAVIRKHPFVNECLVFGVRHYLYGEKIICYYQLNDNVNVQSSFDTELKKYCSDILASYEIPNEFCLVEQLPLTSNGKISIRIAQEHYESTHHAEG